MVTVGRADASLHVLVTDATSGVRTYPGARSLPISVSDEDGTIPLDFNRAASLPCSFPDFATYPVAPAEDRLATAVEAGETNGAERARERCFDQNALPAVGGPLTTDRLNPVFDATYDESHGR